MHKNVKDKYILSNKTVCFFFVDKISSEGQGRVLLMRYQKKKNTRTKTENVRNVIKY